MDDLLKWQLPEGIGETAKERAELEELWAAKRRSCPATHAHEIGVGLEVHNLAKFLGWPKADVDHFAVAGMFHDVGKMLTPKEILWKPGRLSEEEMAIMRRHAEDGAGILSRFQGPIGEVGAQMANFHHERPDRLGYHAKSAQEVPCYAKICAVADVFEAMTSSHRSYKSAFSPGETLTLMVREAEPGRLGVDQFDRSILHGFVQMKLLQDRTSQQKLEPIYRETLLDFAKNGSATRKAQVAGFKIGLSSFEREVGKDPTRDIRIAKRIARLADQDSELSSLLKDSLAAKEIRGLARLPLPVEEAKSGVEATSPLKSAKKIEIGGL